MKIYIAGPMRGYANYNWSSFEKMAKELRALGHDVVSPTEIDEGLGVVMVRRHEDGSVASVELTSKYKFEDVISRDLEVVAECDAVFLLKGWSFSEGAQMEFAVAEDNGLRIFSSLRDVPDLTVPDVGGKDLQYPILCEEDMLRHKQRIGKIASEGLWAEEVRVVDPETGGAKGSKPCQLFSAPPAGLEALGRVCGMGADKYDLHNFRRGYKWSLSADAMLRHYLAWNAGEDVDLESGVSHLAHVAWHALVLIQFAQDHPDKDDRYRAAS